MGRETLEEYRKIIEDFPRATIAVIGDIVADHYIIGRQSRLSREAPVIVVKYLEERIIPGGAANSVNNLLALGATVYPIGFVGMDREGRGILECLEHKKALVQGIIQLKNWQTITKTRIMVGDHHTSKQQALRIDKEPEGNVDEGAQQKLLEYLCKIEDSVGAFLVSDYGYGTISPAILAKLKEMASRKIIVVDSRYRLEEFRGVTLATPNEAEAEQWAGTKFRNLEDILLAGAQLRERMALGALLLTRGNEGMILFEKDKNPCIIPIVGEKDVTDVTGAGDTVASVSTLALVAGADFYKAARLANYAASVVVMKRGTATLTKEELIEAIENDLGKDN